MFCIVGEDTLLMDIDKFIKNKWFDTEICRHQIDFYSIDYNKYKARTKISTINENRIIYHYDTEITTEIKITIISKLNGIIKYKNIQIIVENDEHILKCKKCDKNAEFIHYNNILCYDHILNEKYINYISNSPRNGICGYNLIENLNDELYLSLRLMKNRQISFGKINNIN